ncbi:MAG: ORF6N domain-containing protein [Bacteroidales bacterium]|nr:ORF6N domain-containing protein [Bacteroidales bacterium]
MIMNIRGVQVMLDRDLAKLYGVETKRLNEQVKRNMERFPLEFCFQLTELECQNLMSHFATSSWGGRRKMPYAFTEQGVAMLSAVLKSETAVKASVQIMKAFVAMRHFIASNAHVFQRLETMEQRQMDILLHQTQTDHQIENIFKRLDQENIIPTQGIFYQGQVFDAYTFATDLIKSAKSRVILIDNYIDESVLLMLSKREEGVSAEIITRRITETLKLDLERHQQQYPPIAMRESPNFHDRFLIIDDTVYHLGASLKDLGKKLFAFSKMEMPVNQLGVVK